MNKSLYCVWNNDELIHIEDQQPAKVILIWTVWEKIQVTRRTGVVKFLPNHEEEAKAFASAKSDEILLIDCERMEK